MTKIFHYAPALIFALLAPAAIVATDLLSEHEWANAYGPNIAASFIELFFAASFVQWFVDRERKKADEPMLRSTNGRVALILTDVLEFMRLVVRAAASGEERRAPMTTFKDLRQAWPDALKKLDFESVSEKVDEYFSPLERWTHKAEDARQRHLEAAADIARYCDGDLAASLQELMNGVSTRTVWEEMLEIIPANPKGGWIQGPEAADEFAAAVETCLREYRESTGARTLASLNLP